MREKRKLSCAFATIFKIKLLHAGEKPLKCKKYSNCVVKTENSGGQEGSDMTVKKFNCKQRNNCLIAF